MLNREDVVRITESVIKDLNIRVREKDDFYSKYLVVELRYQDDVISTDYINLPSTDPYK